MRKASLEDEVTAFEVADSTHPLPENVHVRVRRGGRRQIANPEGLHGLLRARRERPRGSRAAECDQQFPPSEGDCHTPLPCEVRKGNDTTPRACCPNSAA